MIALVVVLGQILPVGRHLVVVACCDDELRTAVVLDQPLQVAGVLLEGGAWPLALAKSQPCHPTTRMETSERPVFWKPSVFEARRALELPVEPVGPGMIRTADELAAGLATHRQQLVPAVAADVVEGA